MIIRTNTHSFVRCWSRYGSFQFSWGCTESKLWDNYWTNSTLFTKIHGYSSNFSFGICSSRSWSKNI